MTCILSKLVYGTERRLNRVSSFSNTMRDNYNSYYGIIIIETDQKEREIKELEEMNVEIYDTRKYGRANLIFLVERG